MKSVSSPGDRVTVTTIKYSRAGEPYKATVLTWTDSGRLRVQPDGDPRKDSKIVSSENVKKLADGHKQLTV